MVLEGVRKISSWARVYKEVGGLNTEYLTTREMPERIVGLPLCNEEKDLLRICSTPASLGEMCQASSLLDLQDGVGVPDHRRAHEGLRLD